MLHYSPLVPLNLVTTQGNDMDHTIYRKTNPTSTERYFIEMEVVEYAQNGSIASAFDTMTATHYLAAEMDANSVTCEQMLKRIKARNA